MEELVPVIGIICQIIKLIYMIHLPAAIIITHQQRKMGMKIDNAPNKWLGIIFQLITVWAILPIYTIKKIIQLIRK